MNFLTNSQELAQKIQKKDKQFKEFVEENEEKLKEEKKALEALGIEGKIFRMGQDGYDKRRNQYATTSHFVMDLSPRFVIFPSLENAKQDVIKVVNYCRENQRAVAVRCGGHQYCGYSSTDPRNLQIDVSKCFPEYEYDEKENTLRCGVSHALGDWAKLNNKHGIYLPMGVCAEVHLGGHVHTGGWGIVGRSHGLLADHVLKIETIQADGTEKTIVRPVEGETDQDNDDLYFAILGGGRGGDFGIVTHWTFKPLRDAKYPNAANCTMVWLFTKHRMRRVMKLLQQYQDLCASGEIPQDYEFMLTITGAGFMNLIPEHTKKNLKNLIPHLLNELTNGQIFVPALIQMWMCYSNSLGGEFDDKWFNAFEHDDHVGKALKTTLVTAKEAPKNSTSYGMANYFIFNAPREMSYPFVKRARSTLHMPKHFPTVFAERMSRITGKLGTEHGCHLVSQVQVYAGSKVAEYAKLGLTSYSWTDQSMMFSHDAFYNVRGENETDRPFAEEWQKENDVVFIDEKTYAERDMRLFAFTFGDNRDLSTMVPFYYDSEEKYLRLRKIKARVDPTGVFVSNPFSVTPLLGDDDDCKQ